MRGVFNEADEYFAVMLPDDLIDGYPYGVLKQRVQVHEREGASFLAFERVRSDDVEKHGVIAPRSDTHVPMEIAGIVEKPKREDAPSNWTVVRRYVLHGSIMGILENTPRVPNSLMPYVQQVAVGVREKLSVFGDDYNTRDGTGERDYIHVMDLARGHVLAVQHLLTGKDSITLNLGTGCAVSVLEMIAAFEQASGQKVPYETCPRRAGDVASVYADASRAREVLGFETAFDVSDMCRDAWRWQKQNPHGYGDS